MTKQKLKDLDHNLRVCKSDLEQTLKSMIYLRTSGGEGKEEELAGLENQRSELLERVHTLSEQVNGLRDMLRESRSNCEAIVTEQVFAGVHIALSSAHYEMEEDKGSSYFHLRETDEGSEVIREPLL